MKRYNTMIKHSSKTAGKTALHSAAKNGHLGMCEALLSPTCSEAIDINATTQYGETALHLAAKHGHLAVCELLLPQTSPEVINATWQSVSCYTVLHLAAMNGHLAVCELLLPQMNSEAINAISKYAFRETALHLAARHGHLAVCELLLPQMSPEVINTISEHGETALHSAARHGHLAVCRWLISQMSPEVINTAATHNSAKHDYKTALQYAAYSLQYDARQGHQEICRLLLDFAPIKQVVNLMNERSKIKAMVNQMVDQFVQEIRLDEPGCWTLGSDQFRLLKLYRALDTPSVNRVDHYVVKYYFELIGVCKVINREAPISSLAPIYDDYMSQVLKYLPYNLLLPVLPDAELSGLDTSDSLM